MKETMERPPAEKGPRSFFYEDEEGKEHEVEGAVKPNTEKGARSFFYTDENGEDKEITGARKWFYKE